MSLNALSFNSPEALTKYVNDNTIPQANVQKILMVDGRWYLFWWA